MTGRRPPWPSGEAPTGRRSRRTTWLVGGGVVGLLAVGAGAWAAISFFQQGAQPAEALPSTTVAYASVDLDPSGSQKIDAFRTLDKFPAFKDQVGIHSVDDVRQKLGDELIKGLGCDGLTFARRHRPVAGQPRRGRRGRPRRPQARPGLGGPGDRRRQGRGRV